MGNLQELRWVLKDIAGMEPARKTIDLEGRLIDDGVWNAIRDRQNALLELVHAIHEYRKLSESKPLTLQGIRLCTRGSGTDFLGLRRFGIGFSQFPVTRCAGRNPLQAPRFNLVLLGVRPTFPQGTSARFLSLEGADVLARPLGT
jgi:hypothetical protein